VEAKRLENADPQKNAAKQKHHTKSIELDRKILK